MSSVEVAQVAHRVSLIVHSRVSGLSLPIDPFVDAVELVLERCRFGDVHPAPEGVSLMIPYLRPMSTYLLEVGGSGLRTFDLDAAAAGDRFMVGADLFLIDGKDDSDVERFVISPVGYQVDAWLFPVAFPVDVARVALAQFGPLSDRQRFFAYFAGVYCDALTVLRDDVRLRTELIRSLGLINGILSTLVRSPSGVNCPNDRGERDK